MNFKKLSIVFFIITEEISNAKALGAWTIPPVVDYKIQNRETFFLLYFLNRLFD